MIGRHSPNIDMDKLRHKFGSALQLDSIFEEHLERERKPTWLKLKHSCDTDHPSPCHWRGELHAISCELQTCWKAGVIMQAETVLKKSGYVIDFLLHFHDWQTCGVDLLRPQGGKYSVILSKVDHALGDLEMA